MSFSKRTSNMSVAAALLVLATFPAEQRAIDENSEPGVRDGHARQIDVALSEIQAAAKALPEDTIVNIGLWGHASADESGSFGWSMHGVDRPTPLRE